MVVEWWLNWFFAGFFAGLASTEKKSSYPIGSMYMYILYGKFTYIWDIYGRSVAKYSIHGAMEHMGIVI